LGDQAIPATVDTSPDYVTTYASIDSATGDAVVVALNKRFDAPVTAKVNVTGAMGSAQVYRLSDASPVIQAGAPFPVTDGGAQLEWPPARLPHEGAVGANCLNVISTQG